MKVQGTYGQKTLHVIGNRSTSGHGNFFSIRMKNQGQLIFEVDENTRGKNYAVLNSKRPLKDGKWHHIAAVRQGQSLKLYIDGELADEGGSKTGIANITTDAALLLGARGLKTAIAQYEDLRIYHTALNAADIKDLVPPVNRPLRAGEIELVATDNAAVILTQNDENLSHFSSSFKELRIGHNTGVTLYQQNSFGGTAQKCYADLPDIRLSRLAAFPKSMRIWSTIGEPFTGKWVIKAPNGQLLSLGKSVLTTASQRSFNELFRFHHNLQQARLQLIPSSDQENAFFKLLPGETPTYLFVDDSEHLQDEFSIINQANNQWLEISADNTFIWTQQKDHRAIFVRVAKMADNEGQVGELAPGEVALYEHVAYHGKTWILSNSEKDVSGKHTHFGDFQDLQDQTSSIRLGPDTGVTLFKHSNYRVKAGNREEEIEDIVKNVPDLGESQIGNDALSSIQIFRTIAPEDVFTSYTTKLSQDYRMVGDQLEEFSSYRTILRFEPGASAVEVSATDLTQIEVEGTTYDIDEARSVTLSPNEMNLIMITSEADGINTPGLKIRTSEMALNERVVIFPNQAAHQQIAALEDGALWNATDAQGNLIVDRKAHSKEEVASVQSTIQRVMATVNYAEATPVVRKDNAAEAGSRVQSSSQIISGATIDQPWELKLKPASNNNSRLLSARAAGSQPRAASKTETLIQEADISQDEFTRLLSQANQVQKPVKVLPGRGSRLIRIGNPFKKIKDVVKKATSVVVGAVKDVVHVIVKTAEGVIDFVVDTAAKVADFVEAVVEKVVKGIKQFIEFLQFLFDWKDILETQRYLVRAVNSGFDFATQAATDAKPLVSAFVDHLQGSVENGMNTLVESLGGDPSAAEESKFELPEAFEWFLSKLLGGSKQAGTNATPNEGTKPSGDSALESFFANFLEALENAIGAGLRVSEGLMGSIQKLIENPQQPQLALIEIIEALRDAIIQSLAAVENVALGLLDVVGEAIQQLQNLLNAEIKIPFISDLFKLIGAGKLTTLNLTTLLLAIPVTVITKITTNEKPFTDALPLADSAQTQVRLATRTVTETQTEDGEKTEAQTEDDDIKELRKSISFTTITVVADTVGHVLNGILDLVPEGLDDFVSKSRVKTFEIASLVLGGISWVFSHPAKLSLAFKDDKEASMETLLWSYRGGLLGADLITMIVAEMSFGGAQRMRRLNKLSIGIWGVASAIDMILAIATMATAEEDNTAIKVADILSEIVSWVPNIACLVRLVDPVTAFIVQAIANGSAVVLTPILGLVVLIADGIALDKLKNA